MHAKVSKENGKKTMNIHSNEHSSFISKTWFYSLVPFFWFFCFLIRNFNSFCSFFITATGLRILTNMLIPCTMLIKNGSSFPPPRLFRETRLFGREEYSYKARWKVWKHTLHLAQVFSCEFCKIFKNTFFHRMHPLAASFFPENIKKPLVFWFYRDVLGGTEKTTGMEWVKKLGSW